LKSGSVSRTKRVIVICTGSYSLPTSPQPTSEWVPVFYTFTTHQILGDLSNNLSDTPPAGSFLFSRCGCLPLENICDFILFILSESTQQPVPVSHLDKEENCSPNHNKQLNWYVSPVGSLYRSLFWFKFVCNCSSSTALACSLISVFNITNVHPHTQHVHLFCLQYNRLHYKNTTQQQRQKIHCSWYRRISQLKGLLFLHRIHPSSALNPILQTLPKPYKLCFCNKKKCPSSTWPTTPGVNPTVRHVESTVTPLTLRTYSQPAGSATWGLAPRTQQQHASQTHNYALATGLLFKGPQPRPSSTCPEQAIGMPSIWRHTKSGTVAIITFLTFARAQPRMPDPQNQAWFTRILWHIRHRNSWPLCSKYLARLKILCALTGR